MSPSSYNDYLAQLKLVKSLAGCLLLTLPIATKNNKIFEVFENIPVPTDGSAHWKTFNCRFDILFGEDVRDLQGRLLHVKRGELGMDLIIIYLEEATVAGFLLWDLAAKKLERLVTEFEVLMYVIHEAFVDSTTYLLSYRAEAQAKKPTVSFKGQVSVCYG